MHSVLVLTVIQTLIFTCWADEFTVEKSFAITPIKQCLCDNSWMKWSLCSREKGWVKATTEWSVKTFLFKEEPDITVLTGGTSFFFLINEIANKTRPALHKPTYRETGVNDLWDVTDMSMMCCDGLDVSNDTYPGYCASNNITRTPRMCSKLPEDVRGTFLHVNARFIDEKNRRLTRIPIMLPPGAIEATNGYFHPSRYYVMTSPLGSRTRRMGEGYWCEGELTNFVPFDLQLQPSTNNGFLSTGESAAITGYGFGVMDDHVVEHEEVSFVESPYPEGFQSYEGTSVFRKVQQGDEEEIRKWESRKLEKQLRIEEMLKQQLTLPKGEETLEQTILSSAPKDSKVPPKDATEQPTVPNQSQKDEIPQKHVPPKEKTTDSEKNPSKSPPPKEEIKKIDKYVIVKMNGMLTGEIVEFRDSWSHFLEEVNKIFSLPPNEKYSLVNGRGGRVTSIQHLDPDEDVFLVPMNQQLSKPKTITKDDILKLFK